MRRGRTIPALFIVLMLLLISVVPLNISYAGTRWSIQTVDSIGDVGLWASLAMDSSGNPYISYYDATDQDLDLAWWKDSAWHYQVVDSAGEVGQYSSLALDSLGNIYISYFDETNTNLKFAYWDGSTWTTQTVDSAEKVGYYASLALDSSGNPYISYQDGKNFDLKFAWWNGAGWSIQTVDSAGSVGYDCSLALDSSGNPHISYQDYTNQDLKIASWDGSTWITQIVDAGYVGAYSSLALDSSGNPYISYYASGLKFAYWDSPVWATQTVDSAEGVGLWCSLALDYSGAPYISYQDGKYDDLKFAWWNGAGWSIQTIDSAGNVGLASSLALDSNGNPCISYYDATNGNLKYASAHAAPPTGSIAINGGNAYTSSTSVTLTLNYTAYGSTVTQVRYSNDGVWDSEAWMVPAESRAWTLTSENGVKTVYYLVMDSDGMVSSTYTDSITLDTTPPTGSLMINSGSSYTNKTSVTLGVTASDPGSSISEVRFSNDGVWDTEGWEAFSSMKTWTLASGEGAKTVFYQIKNGAGLLTTLSASIVLDTTLPVANAGQNQSTTVGVGVVFNGSGSSDNVGIASYLWDFGDGSTGTGVTPSHTYSSVGNFTVSLMVKDFAGNSAASRAKATVEVAIPEFSSTMILILVLMSASALAITLRKRHPLWACQ